VSASFKEMTDFFIAEGVKDLPHTGKTYLAHAIGVYTDMKAWGVDEELCHAAMFHSVYGTQGFQDYTLSLERRGEVRSLIGDRAERLAYWNCAMDRATLEANLERPEGPFWTSDRLTQQRVDLTREDHDDLWRVFLCDFLEQVARDNTWQERREAFRGAAEWLGGPALEAYDRVFADEPAGEAAG
jgi:hypothetical protein